MITIHRITMQFAVITVVAALAICSDAPAVAKTQTFQTPSKRIWCLYSSQAGPGPFIRCDASFLGDFAFKLTRQRARRIEVTDTVHELRAPVLRYGTARRFGPFRCRSRRTGLICSYRRSGHGFTLSRERQVVF
jgi:hypothetical protein